MNAKEKAIIEAIIDKHDKRRHDKALTLLLFGERRGVCYVKNDYVNCLENLVRKKCGGVNFADSYSIFATEFWMHLDRMSPEQLRDINDFLSWLFIVAKNFIETIRKRIEYFQLGNTPINESILSDTTDDTDEVEAEEANCEMENNSGDSELDEAPQQHHEEESEESTSFDEDEQDRLKREYFALWRFHYYLDKMTNETYKDLLAAVYIHGADRESLAEEYAWSMAVFNLTLDHARNALITVALDDIRRCQPDLFRKYEYHKDMDDETASLLRDFFVCKLDMQQLAQMRHKTNYEMKKTLAIAYKKLLRIHRNETELLETENHKEEKKQNRMKRLFSIHKRLLKKEYPQSYWRLSKFFEEFKGEFPAMVEWALNNHINVDELECQLEDSFEVLSAIDIEHSSNKSKANEGNNK